MSQIVIGTAGHIDHGKTVLVKALTGTDTDSHPEEKERGMTIDLGFAFLTDDITIIDVPGHEKFIRNMVAGVSTVDIALLTIAADDGIMPQTREHLDILKLLGVQTGCIAITKIDLVEESEWLDLLEEEIGEYVQDSFLDSAAIIRVSSVTGEGVEELRKILLNLAGQVKEKKDRGFFRLCVDRVFTKKGFGTVVTGTVVSGSLSAGDEVEILPNGIVTKVRALQSHAREVRSVKTGDRAAINLAGIERRNLKRGTVIASRGMLQTTTTIGVEISLISSTLRRLKHEQRIRVHLGTDEILGRVFLAGKEKELKAGESSSALIKLESPGVPAVDDPVIIRFYSPAETMGGGKVIDANPPPKWKICKKWLSDIFGLSSEGRFIKFLEESANSPLTVKDWTHRWQLSKYNIKTLAEKVDVIRFGLDKNPYILPQSSVDGHKDRLIGFLEAFHSRNPYKKGARREELIQKMGISLSLYDFLTELLKSHGKVEIDNGFIRLVGFQIQLKSGDMAITRNVEKHLLDSKFNLLSSSEIATLQNVPISHLLQLLHILKNDNKIVEINRDLWIHAENLKSLKSKVRQFFEKNSRMSVVDFKSFTNTTRKHAIPLLEYLDRHEITMRDGNVRILL